MNLSDLYIEIEQKMSPEDGSIDGDLSDRMADALIGTDDETAISFLRHVVVDLRARPSMTSKMQTQITRGTTILWTAFEKNQGLAQ